MRIVITGASGNVGTALLLALGGHGEHELVGISRRPPPDRPPYSWASWHALDIGAAGAQLELTEAFQGADAVVHLAWQIQPSRDRGRMRRTNVEGTRAVALAARRAGVGQLVHQSSVGAYAAGPSETVSESWPATGIPSSSYSVDKAEAESVVDTVAADLPVARMRPALIFQDAAASEVMRYFLGPLVPAALMRPSVLRWAPLPPDLRFQVVHADDVAAAIALVIERRAVGAYNVAAEPVISRATFQSLFGGVGPAVPARVLRAVASASWHARLQPTEPGWLDLAMLSPLLDTARLRALGWAAPRDAGDVLSSFVAAMHRSAGRPGPLLYRRSPRAEV